MTTTPSSTVHPYTSASLYVGDLAKDVNEALLFEIFNNVGPVASVRICRDTQTRRSLGYAYVNFHRAEDAERALDTMMFKPIKGTPCRIMWSHRDPSLRKSGVGNVFVKNLAKNIDSRILYDTFSMFGNILSCKVAQNVKGESLGYGFVHYESEESAQNAIRADGKLIQNQKISVTPFKPKRERADKVRYTNIYVKHLPPDFTKEKLDVLFRKYGSITSSMLANDKDGKFKGVAFVNYSNPEEAKAAIEAMKDQKLIDKPLVVVRHQTKSERERELRARWEQRKQERQKHFTGVNLYVKNLADTIDDKRLAAEFSPHGTITSAKVMIDDSEKSKGFGFVCFTTQEEATRAVSALNGQMLEGKPLYVGLAQRKEERRLQLEAQYAARGGYGPPMYPGPQAPLFYPTLPQQRPLIYSQVMPRWQGPTPQMMGMAGQQVNYQLMPIPRQGGGPPRGRGRGRGGGAGRAQLHPQAAPPAQQYDRQVRYNQNVRNAQMAGQQPMASVVQRIPQAPRAPAAVAPAVPQPAPSVAPPTLPTILAGVPPEKQKTILGEKLFPLISAHRSDLAAKITGMLLEMDNGELLELIESQSALVAKIKEAIEVLNTHEEGDEEEADEEA
jgi:polyadenylate-binding protein